MCDERKRYFDYLKSDEWRARRAKVLDRDGHKCRSCGSQSSLQVHHLHYDNLFHERSRDLLTLCDDCHVAVHTEQTYKQILLACGLDVLIFVATRARRRKNPSRLAPVWSASGDEIRTLIIANDHKGLLKKLFKKGFLDDVNPTQQPMNSMSTYVNTSENCATIDNISEKDWGF